jgi:CRISPR/Cas system CMR subunit Cmr6 (Cas7 group RAMP superfamily)
LNVLSAKETKIDSASKIIADISVVKETSVAATVALDQAKVLVKEGSLKDALDKVSESKEIKNQADVILDKLQVVAQEKALVDANASSTASTLNNTTSTPKIIGTSTPKVISTSSPKI